MGSIIACLGRFSRGPNGKEYLERVGVICLVNWETVTSISKKKTIINTSTRFQCGGGGSW